MVAVAQESAGAIDARIKQLVHGLRSAGMELGALLCRVKRGRLYRELGFKWFKDYVAHRDLSISYAERVMRAHKCLEKEPRLEGLGVDKVNFVANVASRVGSGKSLEEWIAYAQTNTKTAFIAEKKLLTRAGVLPPKPQGRGQAIAMAHVDGAIQMQIRVPPRTHRLFEAQCEAWGLSKAGTILKLLVLAQKG